jgi:hypothetical protein
LDTFNGGEQIYLAFLKGINSNITISKEFVLCSFLGVSKVIPLDCNDDSNW